MNELRYQLSVFRKEDETYVRSFDLNGIPLRVLREAANVSLEDPDIIGDYRLEQGRSHVLEQALGIKFDFENFLYSVGAYADS